MAIDAQRFVEISTFINLIWSAPFQIVVALFFLYLELGNTLVLYGSLLFSALCFLRLNFKFIILYYSFLGYSALISFLFLIILIPLNAWLTKIAKKLQIKQMKLKDSRVMIMNEILSGMKIIKLYGWENAFINKVQTIRKKELVVLKKINIYVCILQML